MRICWDSFRSSIPDGWLRSSSPRRAADASKRPCSPRRSVVQSREETGVRWGVEGDLGIIASQATVTAPLTDRAALFLSGRRSCAGNRCIGALSPKGEDDLNYRLQDYDATLAWQIDDHNKLIVNSHYGDDPRAYHLQRRVARRAAAMVCLRLVGRAAQRTFAHRSATWRTHSTIRVSTPV